MSDTFEEMGMSLTPDDGRRLKCTNCHALTHRADCCSYEPEVRIEGSDNAFQFVKGLMVEHRTFKSMNIHDEYIFLVKKEAYNTDLPEAKTK